MDAVLSFVVFAGYKQACTSSVRRFEIFLQVNYSVLNTGLKATLTPPLQFRQNLSCLGHRAVAGTASAMVRRPNKSTRNDRKQVDDLASLYYEGLSDAGTCRGVVQHKLKLSNKQRSPSPSPWKW